MVDKFVLDCSRWNGKLCLPVCIWGTYDQPMRVRLQQNIQKRSISGTLAFADNKSEKNRYVAALNQPLSPREGDQNLQSKEPGWASSLTASCKGERSTRESPPSQQPYSTGRETRRFPKTRSAREGAEQPAAIAPKRGRFPSASPGPRAGRKTRGGSRCGLGTRPTQAVFRGLLSVSESRFIFKGPLQQGNNIPFLLQLGNVGTDISLTFPRLPSQRGEEKPDLSWSADQSLKNTQAILPPASRPRSLRFSIFTEGMIWAEARTCKTEKTLLFDLHRKPQPQSNLEVTRIMKNMIFTCKFNTRGLKVIKVFLSLK